MQLACSIVRIWIVAVVALVGLGCVEAKVGIGPFKAISVEAGPGGVEAKGPSAGPFKVDRNEKDSGRRRDE